MHTSTLFARPRNLFCILTFSIGLMCGDGTLAMLLTHARPLV